MKQSFALLDIGGTDIKSCVTNKDDTNLRVIYRSGTPGNLQGGQNLYEISPSKLLLEIKNHLDSILSYKTKIDGLIISGQMGSWIISDSKNQPITNLISWQDNRAAVYEGNFNVKMIERLGTEWLEKTGNEVRSGLPLFGIEKMKSNLAYLKNLRLHTLISWVSSQLSEDYLFQSHVTDFASTGMIEINSNTWSKAAINFIDFDLELPTLLTEMKAIGFSKALSCPIYAPVGDQQASLYGAELKKGKTVVNIGTGGQVAAISSSNQKSALQTRPYFNDLTIDTRTHLPAGRLISRCVKLLFPEEDTINAFAKFLKQSEKFATDAYLDIDLLGHGNFMSEFSDRDYAPSAILNGIAVHYRKAISEINLESCDSLIFAGGIGQKFKKLQNTISRGKTYEIAKSEESTLRGLMLLSKNL